MPAESLVGHYAVIFVSQRRDGDPSDGERGYDAAATRMLQLAAQQDGYLGVVSARDGNGLGITVSYWRDLNSIKAWREHSEHTIAREHGRHDWYLSYQLQIAKIERASSFTAH